MCLYVDKNETKRIKRRFAAAKKRGLNYIICYKELCLNSRIQLKAPFYKKIYKPGWNKSNRKYKTLSAIESSFNEVNKGIHVYLNPNKLYATGKLIKCRCYEKDLVAGGEDKEAVFMKVFITKKDYQDYIKILKQEKNNG